jgi:hypothetical protein
MVESRSPRGRNGISAEQAVDETISRIKHILSE